MSSPRPPRNGPSRTGEPLTPLRLRVSRRMAGLIDQAATAAGTTGATWVRGAWSDCLSLDDPAERQPVRR